MKKFIYTSLILLLAVSTQAQVLDTVLHYSDSVKIMDNVSHVVDAAGNTYFLCTAPYIDGIVGYDTYNIPIVTKASNQAHILWHQYYNNPRLCVELQHLQAFLTNDNLVLPAETGFGLPEAYGLNHNRIITMATADGSILSNSPINGEDSGQDYRLLSCQQYTTAQYAYIYSCYNDSSMHCYLTITDTAGNNLYHAATPHLQNALSNIVYNTATHNWAAVDSAGAFYIYDSIGYHLLSHNLSPNTNMVYSFVSAKVITNGNYYVVNYGLKTGSATIYYTAVFSAAGTLISQSSSPRFYDFTIAPNNFIWTVIKGTDTTKPVSLSFMDVQQKHLWQKNIGYPHVSASCITIDDGWVTVTGTQSVVPFGLYLYRQSVIDTGMALTPVINCDKLSIYPNPVSGHILLTDDQLTNTQTASVAIFNTLGQRMGTYLWKQQQLDIDISSYLAGMYIVHVSDPSQHRDCIQKIVKDR